jgi:hypothetical protein
VPPHGNRPAAWCADITAQVPGYDEKTFRIEGKKKIKTKQGVHHEIDIWVNVEIAVGLHGNLYF